MDGNQKYIGQCQCKSLCIKTTVTGGKKREREEARNESETNRNKREKEDALSRREEKIGMES